MRSVVAIHRSYSLYEKFKCLVMTSETNSNSNNNNNNNNTNNHLTSDLSSINHPHRLFLPLFATSKGGGAYR